MTRCVSAHLCSRDPIPDAAASGGATRQLKLTPPGTAEFVICDHTIEENFWEDNSKGLQVASSLMRWPEALARLGLVLALTTLSLVSVGTVVVQHGNRRLVDPHWLRGLRYLKSGWTWVSDALRSGDALISSVYLSRACDPEPAIASKKQEQLQQCRFAFEQ